ncbi:MAG: hypothetical protein J0M04_24650 [Verrucomicrobia bacterium]|nr:hypothetical protein [Verrucomicrobiota bacterium]
MKTSDKPLNFIRGWNAALDAAAIVVGSQEQLAGMKLEPPAGTPGALSWKVSRCCVTAEILPEDSGYLILKAGDCVRAMFATGSENTRLEDIPLPDNGSVEDAKQACEAHRDARRVHIISVPMDKVGCHTDRGGQLPRFDVGREW